MPLACSMTTLQFKRSLQLLVEDVALAHAALVEPVDGSYIGERLAHTDSGRAERAGFGAEQVDSVR
jgi:hypothetical protein